MVTRFGMDGDLGQMVYEPKRQSFLGDHPFTTQAKSYSEDTGRRSTWRLGTIVKAAYARAADVLAKRKSELETGAALLLEKRRYSQTSFFRLKRGRAWMAFAHPILPSGRKSQCNEALSLHEGLAK